MAGVKEIAVSAIARPRTRPVTDAGAARFERLWTAHYAAVHAHAARRVGERADEVCAEVFLVAWRRLDEIPCDELPWLLAVSRNAIGTAWRGDARRARLRERLDGQAEPGGDAGTGPLDAPLEDALAALGEADRELLLLVYWEGLAPSRAAKVLGLAPAAARTRLWRSRRRLRRSLESLEDRNE
jgi:RNA polymerase sigma-70 factor (ECF subfamily)